MSRRWQTALGLLLSVALIYWALHDVALSEAWGHVRDANLPLLLLAVGLQTSAFLIRAHRWRYFLRPTLGRPAYRALFGTTCIGFMANNLLPARVGEFARAYALSRVEPIGVSASFGSLVVERIFDALVLALFLAVPVLIPGLIAAPGIADRIAGQLLIAVLLFGGAAAVLVILIRQPRLAGRVFRKTVGRALPGRLAERVTEVLRSFLEGLGSLRSPALIGAGIVWTLIHWLWTGLAYLVGLLSFGIVKPGYAGSLFLLAVNAFAVAIPSSPGFFGPFEASVRLALAPFGVEAGRAVSFAVAFHVGTFIPVTLLGLWYVGRLGLSWGEVGRSEELVEEAGGVPGSPPTS